MKKREIADEKYRKTMKNKGLIKICLVVPENKRADMMAYAEALRTTNNKGK